MKKYIHISKSMPKSAPRWLVDAAECGSSVLCVVWNVEGFEKCLAYIFPMYGELSVNKFRDTEGSYWRYAEPVKNPETIEEDVPYGK